MKLDRPDAKHYFERAGQFHYSAYHLMQLPHQMQFIHAVPSIVLKAFACEAYLKCLILLEGNEPLIVHHLLRLFDQLELPSKKAIKRWWDKESLPILKRFPKDPETLKGYKPPKNFRDALNQSSEAFIDWRYRQQGTGMGMSVMAFPLFVRRRILEVEPSFRVPGHNPLSALDPEPEVAETKDKHFVVAAFRPPELNRKRDAWTKRRIKRPDADDGGADEGE